MKKKKGFTIVELVVVIAVIGILSAILIPTFIDLTRKAQVANMESFVVNINKKLAMNESTTRKNNNMYEAIQDAKEIGFDVEKITPYDNHDIVWDSESDRFVLIKGENIIQQDTASKVDLENKKHNLFKVAKSKAEAENLGGYSVYVGEDVTDSSITVSGVGIDAGSNEHITQITYSNTNELGKVIIRTNSSNLNLSINDNTGTKIYHYDKLGKLEIATGFDCYYEFGTTAYAKASAGKIVAKAGGTIEVLYASIANVSAKQDGGNIEKAYCISSSAIEATEAGYTNYSNSKGGDVVFEYVDEDGNPLTQTSQIEEIGESAVMEAKSVEETEQIENAKFWEQCAEDVSFHGGKGTEQDPYLISSATQLALLAYNINNSVELTQEEVNDGKQPYYGAYYKLMANLDISKMAWTPIGASSTKPFSGHIDGNKKTITGMTNGLYRGEITENEYTHHIGETYGFIAFTKDAVSVKDLTIRDIDVNYNNAKICGGLIGYTKPSSGSTSSLTISNVNVEGSIKGYDKVAGLVGYLYNVSTLLIEDCVVDGTLSLTDYYSVKDNKVIKGYRAGGLFGYVSTAAHEVTGEISHEVRNTTVNATISSGTSTASYFWLGGITSGFNNTDVEMKFVNFEFTGTCIMEKIGQSGTKDSGATGTYGAFVAAKSGDKYLVGDFGKVQLVYKLVVQYPDNPSSGYLPADSTVVEAVKDEYVLEITGKNFTLKSLSAIVMQFTNPGTVYRISIEHDNGDAKNIEEKDCSTENFDFYQYTKDILFAQLITIN